LKASDLLDKIVTSLAKTEAFLNQDHDNAWRAKQVGNFIGNAAKGAWDGIGKMFSGGSLSPADAKSAAHAGKMFNVDPRLIYGEYYAETSLGTNNPRGGAYNSMGLISGPGAYRGYGYKDSGQNTLSEAFRTDAAMWADSARDFQKLYGHAPSMQELVSYHESSYAPPGAKNDPDNLNVNKVSSVWAGIHSATVFSNGAKVTVHVSPDSRAPNNKPRAGTRPKQ
jgi:hypothetical protein